MSRNYEEDQKNEIEALESIYCGDMIILESTHLYKFKIPIATEEFADEQNGLSCHLVFTYTPKYPEEGPVVEVEDTINFEDSYVELLLEHVNKTIEENLGMEMIFPLVSSAQEWLNEQWDEHKKIQVLEQERELRENEEAERQRFEGTRVTVESFMKWKLEFEESFGVAAKREKNSGDGKKLTGKELFLRDNTLNESDIKFLLEAGDSLENVKIDESLFQDINDLDLEDDSDEDDEDYVP